MEMRIKATLSSVARSRLVVYAGLPALYCALRTDSPRWYPRIANSFFPCCPS